MKEKVLKNLQAFSKGIFVPVLILPIVGILFAFASIFTNSRVYNTITFLNHPFFINFGKILGQSLIPIIGTYLGILFAVGIAIGMAKKEKHYAALVAMLSYFVFIHSMNIYIWVLWDYYYQQINLEEADILWLWESKSLTWEFS